MQLTATFQRGVHRVLGIPPRAANIDGMKLPLDRQLMSARVRRTLIRGKYEDREAQAAMRLFRPGDIVLELGAGIGFLSAYLRRHTQVGRIITYEANPALIPYITGMHAINGVREVDVRHGVVLASPASKTVPFHLRQDLWSSSLSPEGLPVVRSVEVPAVPWADVIAEAQPTALAIDIEGGEADLIGACDLGPIRRVLIELHPAACGVAGMARLYGALDRQGFRNQAGTEEGMVLALER